MTTENHSQTPLDLARYLVDLNMNQDQVAQKWLEFLITIEAGLAVASAFLLRPGEGNTARSLPPGALVLVAAFGIIVAIALTWIVVRERKWQGLYAGLFNEIPGCHGKVFPVERGNIGPVGNQPLDRISQIIIGLGAFIVASWIVVIVSVWRGWLTTA